jgi:hypothetical protein
MQALKPAQGHTSLQEGYMSLSRTTSWLKGQVKTTKTWLKDKSKSKPFQWIISVGQGVSFGSSLHDALTKILSISTLTGLAARIFGNVNYGTAALVGIILTYMTRNAISTNIKNMDEQGEKVLEHEVKLEAGEKQFLNQQLADIKLLEILIKMNTDKPALIAELNQLLDEKINSYDPFGKKGLEHPEEKQQNSLNSLYRASSNNSTSSRSINYNYHEMLEITQPQQPATPSRRSSQAYSHSDRFFSSPPTDLHITIFPNAPINTQATDLGNNDVAIEIHDNEEGVGDEHAPSRAMRMGSSRV